MISKVAALSPLVNNEESIPFEILISEMFVVYISPLLLTDIL